MHCNSKYIIEIFVTSSLCSGGRSSTINMASFVAIDGECASAFQNSPLFYVYCVSKEDFPVCPIGLPCVGLMSRQVHVSFVDGMAKRRIALVALNNGRVQMEDLFCNVRSSLLISLRTTNELQRKKEVKLRVEHEPHNISDCNALKFEVLSAGQ